jgi:CRP-like cAMP-binding protein
MPDVHSILIRKLKEHSRLAREDLAALSALRYKLRDFDAHEDLVRQGDGPNVSALVVAGTFARYHLLPNGRRQYLSFHLPGDMPDSQALFIEKMDHAVCAVGPAVAALIPHKDLLSMFEHRPCVGFAIWRETLIDAAIFREAITNNSARTTIARLAHLFCELFYRAKASRLTQGLVVEVPVSLVQLAETLAMSIATINRTLLELRESGTVHFQRGRLEIKDWDALVVIGQFNPSYLHQKRPPV